MKNPLHGRTKWDLIYPVLVGLEPFRRGALRKLMGRFRNETLSPGVTILDVGSGTGTVTAELLHAGYDVVAAEPTLALAAHLERRFPGLRVLREPAEALVSLEDDAVDWCVVAAVLHGLPPAARASVYAELTRVARRGVIVLDYHQNRNPLVAAVEWLEGGDYFSFVRIVEEELRRHFDSLTVLRFSPIESAYICRLEPPGQ